MARPVRAPSRILVAVAFMLACLLATAGSSQSGSAAEQVRPLRSSLGSYLAGRIARGSSDGAAAASYFTRALKSDPQNEQLTSQAFESKAIEGDWPAAELLATQLVALNSDQQLAQIFLGLKAFRELRHPDAERHLLSVGDGINANPIGSLISLLARGWVRVADDRGPEALRLLDETRQPEWAQQLIRYHRALMADVSRQRQEARSTYDRMFRGQQQRSLRTVLAYAQHLHTYGDTVTAQRVLRSYLRSLRGEGHPTARVLLENLQARAETGLLINTASQGMGEAFFQIGEALSGDSGLGPGAIFLQFSLYMEPNSPFALTALAAVYEATSNYRRAIETYERIEPGTPFEMAIGIRKAINLNLLEQVDEAKSLLEQVAASAPRDVRPLEALGSILRSHKRYEEAIEYLSRAIELVGEPQPRHWTYFYARGASYERIKKWPQAEADLKRALSLSPDQADVLNYLGYSWVDQGVNLKEGFAYIERAVRLKPDDGYIIDSLGWAHYRLGNFPEAVRWLELAVEKKADDPILNDHLGDAYWRVGRRKEAVFQWRQALKLNPEPEEIEKINKKLVEGLPELEQDLRSTKSDKAGAQKKRRADTRRGPATRATP